MGTAFSVAAPKLWDSLSRETHLSSPIGVFHHEVKAFLFHLNVIGPASSVLCVCVSVCVID